MKSIGSLGDRLLSLLVPKAEASAACWVFGGSGWWSCINGCICKCCRYVSGSIRCGNYMDNCDGG